MTKNEKLSAAASCALTLSALPVCLLTRRTQGDNLSTALFLISPALLLAAQVVCLFFVYRDPANKAQSKKVLSVAVWLFPVASCALALVRFYGALGGADNTFPAVCALTGLLFAIIGNYLPKCRRNSTVGIKVGWALADDGNWYATHRFAGAVWTVCGALTVLTAFLPQPFAAAALAALLAVITVAPVVRSYVYYKQHGCPAMTPASVKKRVFTAVVVAAAAAALCFLLFAGEIAYSFGDDRLTVGCTFWPQTSVSYGEVEAIAYLPEVDPGEKINGFDSPKLLAGEFSNAEFGRYTRYSYTACPSCVVLKLGSGASVALNCKTEDETRELCQRIADAAGIPVS